MSVNINGINKFCNLMIQFYRPAEEDSFSDQVEETLEDLVLAHRVNRVSSDEESSDSDSPSVPRIEDDEGIYYGKEQIEQYLQQMRADVSSMRAFTSDACYIDRDSGEIC